ncbi:MAG: phage portal protein [Alphaproteobacteria bacterium]|nr:phage portal protein [Alphaproteobacteria bacterium]
MNVLNYLSRLIPGTKASAAAGMIAARSLGQPVWTPRRFDKIAEESYKRNAIAFACVKRIASGCASVRWLLHRRGGEEVGQHPLLNLLENPSPCVGGRQFLEAVYAYLLLAGNTYIEAVGPKRASAPPRELWPLRPDRMKVVPGPASLPKAFEYEVGGLKTRWEMDPLKGTGPILHLRDFNPLDDWYGMSRIEAAAYGVDRHNAAGAHNKALLDNQCRPSGALVFKPIKNPDGSYQSAPEDVIDKAKKRLDETHGGASNAGRPMVLGGDVAWEEMGLSPKDMDFAAGKDDAAWDICVALGFPPVLMVKGQATYNNVREAKLELWEETNLPLIDHLCAGLNSWLVPQFGDDLVLSPDLDGISALEPRRESKRKSTLELVEAGIIDADEARESLQFGKRPVNAVEKVDAAVLNALINAVADAGTLPLVRYLRSVGLYDASKTDEQLIAFAIAETARLTGADPDEAGETTGEDTDPDEEDEIDAD